jgi:hypothetical protein
MFRKRDVLKHFKRDELLATVDRFELVVEERRVKGGLDASAGSRWVGLAEILGDLPRAVSAAVEAKLAKARQIKQGMMQELLTGRIRLV